MSLTVDLNDKPPLIAADLSKLADVKYEGKKALVVHGGRGYPRAQWHDRAGVHGHKLHQRPHDFAKAPVKST